MTEAAQFTARYKRTTSCDGSSWDFLLREPTSSEAIERVPQIGQTNYTFSDGSVLTTANAGFGHVITAG